MRSGPEGAGGRHRIRAALLSFALVAGSALSVPAAGQTGAPTTVPPPGSTRTDSVPGTSVSVTLAYIPGGTFSMGSPATEAGRHDDEGPAHPVALPGFWMSVHEVTAEQYAPYRYAQFDGDAGPAGPGSFDVDAVTRPSPPYEDPTRGMGSERRPATGVTRWNALHYARWLSEKTGRLYRLPTEAEWEYACRAGAGGAWGFGDDPARAPAYAWLEMNAGGATHPVGGKESNAWGLHDMHGNVAEWVLDGYDADAYGPRGGSPPAESPRVGHAWRGQGVVRGGAFDDGAADARCAERFPETPAWKRRDPQIPKSRWWNTDSPHVGFRLVSPDRAFTLDEIRAYFDEILGG